jgi:predicted membrane protein
METDSRDSKRDPNYNRFDNRSGRVWGGVLLVIIGVVFLARRAGIDFPHWLFSWEMIVIAIGLYVGVRRSFRPGGWMIAVAVGGVFMLDDVLYDINLKPYLWPSIIIAFGLYMIFRPRANFRGMGGSSINSSEDTIDAVSIFGGTKRNIISKDFKGGDITTVFGGTDLNLMQADFKNTIDIELTQVFGGTKLIIPANWSLKSEVVTIFGGIDDKRPMATEAADPTKIVILKGTCIFGGIDIKSY